MSLEPLIISMLTINCPLGELTGEIEVTAVDSAAAALQAVRWNRFDLMLSSTRVQGSSIWPLAQKLRRVRPKLQWWLVAEFIEPQEEIRARSIGVNRIFEITPSVNLICAELKRLPLSVRASNAPPPGAVSVTTTGIWPKLIGTAGGEASSTGPPRLGENKDH